jgi:membrane-bound lytic murein transglycosylase B
MRMWSLAWRIVWGLSVSTAALAGDVDQDPQYLEFKKRMVEQHQFDATNLDQLFGLVERKANILSIMTRPGESKEWYDYRDQFVTPTRISKGVAFASLYRSALERAEEKYGVPRAVILGILGVETGFGANKGSFRTIDALTTLAFGYPRRAEFFQNELAEFLILAREQQLDPLTVRSSYAGAIGYPQFMPSSIRKFAVDFDGDQKIDLRNSATDAIGSIANYLSMHGWQKGHPIGVRAIYTGQDDTQVIATDLTKPRPASELKALGLSPVTAPVADTDLVNGIRLMEENGAAYWMTYPNFQVITTYNRSRMYATAVWQLGQAIVEAQ